MKLFNKILIANRGEIAVRIMKTAKKLGVNTVGIYSKVDADSLHIEFADESYCIGEVELSDTYLNINKIIDIAKKTNCDAIHPGYGFFSENSLFVHRCEEAGLVFIGPNTQAMKMMGNKIEARNFAKSINVPITEGVTGDVNTLLKAGKTIPYPLLIKAAAGGGGKGMRIVYSDKELKEALESTSREAKSYFGDGTVYVEKYIEEPRHIEFQIIGDNYGNVIHLFERECTIQRRYQKIIEESPSVTLTPEKRKKMGEAAVRIGKEIKYNNAGTIEFLVDKDLNFYFLEANTRIQVEHPITEMVTGIDIVEEQIYIAAGNELRLKQEDIKQNGHAVECRIYAEDPANDFLPSPGKMTLYKEPSLKGIRIDTGVTEKTEIKSFFDPMICKLITWAEDRDKACKIMTNALNNYIIHGINNNIQYLAKVLQNKDFLTNRISTKFCETYTNEIINGINSEKENIPLHIPTIAFLLYSIKKPGKNYFGETDNIWNTIGYWRSAMSISYKYSEEECYANLVQISDNLLEFEIDNNRYIANLCKISEGKHWFFINETLHTAYISEDSRGNVHISISGHIFTFVRTDILTGDLSVMNSEEFMQDTNNIMAPMPGKVIKINVEAGDKVSKGDVLLIIEAMKMENSVTSQKEAVVEKVNVSVGKMVDGSTPLIILKDEFALISRE